MVYEDQGLAGSGWDLIWAGYERAKAKLMSYLGSFLQLRDKLLSMRGRVDLVVDEAKRRGNTELIVAGTQLRGQINDSWNKQIELEDRINTVRDRIAGMDTVKAEGDTDELGFAVSAGVVIAAVAVIAATAGALVIHMQRVAYLHRLLDLIERKVLTPEQAAGMRGGLSLGGFSLGGILPIAAVGIGMWWFMGRKKRR